MLPAGFSRPAGDMIQLTTHGPTIVRDDEWAEQQRTFARDHWVQLRDFIAPAALERASELLSRRTASFYRREHSDEVHGTIAAELCLRENTRPAEFLWLLFNQPRLFAAIRELTGIDRTARCFAGRCNKMVPGAGHFIPWHTDANGRRLLGLRVNLTREAAAGGNLQLRGRGRGRGGAVAVQTIPNEGYGDATLFRIAPWLEHRVLPAQGVTCRYVGWIGFTMQKVDRIDAFEARQREQQPWLYR